MKTRRSLPLRLRDSFLRRYYRVFRPRFFVARRMGAMFLVDQRNIIDRKLLLNRAWEARQVQSLFEFADRMLPSAGRHFLDVGAHAGLYSVLFARHSDATRRIVAVEPDPVNLAQLGANLLLNGLVDRVEVLAVAATDRTGTITLHVAPDSNRGLSRLDDDGAVPFENAREIEGRRLDDVIDIRGGAVVAKIDVEGHELQAHEGMREILRANQCVLRVEIFSHNVPSVTAALSDLGYRPLTVIDSDHYFTNVG